MCSACRSAGTEGERAANNNEAESAPAEDSRLRAGAAAAEARRLRTEAVASANAAGLLCDLVLNGCAGDACTTRCVSLCALRAGRAV